MVDFYKGTIPIISDDPKTRDIEHPREVSYGLVPRDYNLYPEEMFAPPVDMPLIDVSELDARYDEQEANGSSLEHIFLSGPGGQPAFVNLDQDGNGYCHTADTEVLTERGWTAWPDYNWSDLLGTTNTQTGMMEFQVPFEKHVYDYDGEMVYSTNRRINFGVTPDHRMLVRKWDEAKRTLSDQYTFQKAGEIGWYAGLLHAPRGFIGTELERVSIESDREYLGDDFLAMLSVIVSDGYVTESEGHTGQVGFCCFNEKRYPVVAAMAHRVGFKEVPSRKGVWARYSAHALTAWLKANCYVGNVYKGLNKKIPDIVKCASGRQIEYFLKMFGDQKHSAGDEAFYSSSKRIIDDLQELLLRIGKRSSITSKEAKRVLMPQGTYANCKESFTLCVSKTDRLCIERKKHIETDHYKGPVYCAAVPNGTLITRRNGSVLISGNCWSYSTGSAIMMNRLASGQPMARINPHGPAAIIKGGKDEGGWCGLSAKFSREVGYPTEEFWPVHSRSLSNDTPAMRANCALHKVTEDYVDLTKSVYDQNLTKQQLWTCLFRNMPCPVDFNHWSHSVCGIRWVRTEPGAWGLLILNSWKGWGRFGLGVLLGSKAIPNGALCVRVTGGSTT